MCLTTRNGAFRNLSFTVYREIRISIRKVAGLIVAIPFSDMHLYREQNPFQNPPANYNPFNSLDLFHYPILNQW